MTMNRFVRAGASILSLLLACTPEPKGQGETCDADGGTLPAAGSVCASAGEVCKPPAGDPCAPEPYVECAGGKWVEKPGVPADDCGGTSQPTTGTGTEPTTDGTTATPMTSTGTTTETGTGTTAGTTGGGVVCDPNDLPEPGTPCANEGEFCSPGCTDPCQFCNVVKCENGVWIQLEAPPAPCASCEEICPATVAAMCPGGPPDLEACVPGCMDTMNGRCSLQHSQVRACIGPAPTFTCDAMGRPTVIGCEDLFDALYMCLGI